MTQDVFFRIFNTDRKQMEQTVAAGMSGGGSWCDLYFEYTVYNDLMLRDGEVNSGGYHEDFGVGIRVLSGEKTGYAYSESTVPKDMLAAAEAAATIASSGMGAKAGSVCASRPEGKIPGHAVGIPASGRNCTAVPGITGTARLEGGFAAMHTATPHPDLYPAAVTWDTARHERFLPFLKRLENSVRARDSRVEKVIARISDCQSHIMMFNSNGELVCDSRPMCSITVSAIFVMGDRRESKTASWSYRCGAEMIGDALAEQLAEETVSGIDARFEAKRPKGGEMPVVMGAGASGILLHEAMGHAFEADFNRKGQSVFSGKTGQKICSPDISIVDDGTIAGNRGACNYDDEGVPGQKTYMVKDGILTSYLHDRISASWYGVAPTGNGRRESFRFNPIPRMRATYMENGTAAPEDIIASVRHGIYVDEFSNGQVRIGEGDFTFYVRSGFLIEDGRLTAPVKDINVIGNGPEALARIEAVGNDLKIDNGTWTCGKEQSVPVSLGIPTVLISSLIVGGE